jgi:SAM-dependent methyltransferase
MAGMAPATSPQIAHSLGLNERYVREWLGGMVTSGIVEYDPGRRTYGLPAEHAASLTRSAGSKNIAFYALQRLSVGIDVADIGCGAGHAVCLMAKEFPRSRFTGYDFSEEGVALGSAEAASLGLTNAKFELKDVSTLSGPPSFDFITAFDAIHDQAAPRRVLRGIADSLRQDGDFLCVDVAASSNLEENIGNPGVPLLFVFSTFHCVPASLAQGGEALGTVWGEQKAYELFREAGFSHVETRNIQGDAFNNYYLLRK